MTDSQKQVYLKEFGGRVREARIARGMTQEALANAVGYTSDSARGTIQKIEAGKSDLGCSKVPLIARALNVSVGYLMGYDNERQKDERQICDLMAKCYGTDVYAVVSKFLQLDAEDRGYVNGVIDTKLEQEKYRQEAYASA